MQALSSSTAGPALLLRGWATWQVLWVPCEMEGSAPTALSCLSRALPSGALGDFSVM